MTAQDARVGRFPSTPTEDRHTPAREGEAEALACRISDLVLVLSRRVPRPVRDACFWEKHERTFQDSFVVGLAHASALRGPANAVLSRSDTSEPVSI
jgi:hypothetical protein